MRPRGEHLVTAEKKPERRVEKNKGVRKRETEGVRRRSGWFLFWEEKEESEGEGRREKEEDEIWCCFLGEPRYHCSG